jgi:hypothetical protein
MFGHEGIPLPRTTAGAEASKQGMEICRASSVLKTSHYREMRKANGNRAEPWPNSFLGESSDKGLSTQHLRPNFHPIYQLSLPILEKQ